MKNQEKLYLITSNAEAGAMETLPVTEGMEVISSSDLLQSDLFFTPEMKVMITSEACIETIKGRVDDARKRAIEVLKDKYEFRKIVADIYPDFKFQLVGVEEITHLKIDRKSVIKPVKGCFGTAVREIVPQTDMEALKSELLEELNQNGAVLSEDVLSKEAFLVEQYIDGEEYAVDMFYDSKGVPCILNIYHHPMPENKSYLHMMYNSSKKAFDKIYVQAVAYFKSLNEILKVRNFAIHSEFKEDKGSLIPVEMNTMRFGGMGLGSMGYYAMGLNSYACFLNDTEPDWDAIWQGKEEDVFSYFIAYNAAGKSVLEYRPNREKLKQQFSQVLLERSFDYQKQLTFGVYCLKETEERIGELLKIEFGDYFEKI
jgi:hypothetical protein